MKEVARRIRIVALAGALLALGTQAGEVLDNAKVIKMMRDKVPLKVILKLMEPPPNAIAAPQAANCRFDGSSEAMVELQKAGQEGGWPPADIEALQLKVIDLANKDQKYLKEMVDRGLNVFENADEEEYEAMMRALVNEGKRVVPYLLNKTQEESERKRKGVVDAMGRIGDKSENVVRAMTLMLFDKRSKPVRLEAAKCVQALSGPTTADDLMAKLNNRNEMQDGVAMALGYLGDARAIEPLTKLLRQAQDSDARVCSAWALGELRAKSKEARTALLEAVLDERDEKLRESAAVALGKVGEKDAPSYMMKAFHRYRAGRAEMLDQFRFFKDIAVLDFLVEQVESDDPKVKKAAIATLRLLTGENENDREGWAGIVNILRARPDWIRLEQPKIPDARTPRDRDGAQKTDGGDTIPTSTR